MIPTPLVNYHGTSRRGVVSALTIFATSALEVSSSLMAVLSFETAVAL